MSLLWEDNLEQQIFYNATQITLNLPLEILYKNVHTK